MYKLTGYADFKDRRVYDEDIYRHMVKHSNFLDRLNPKKVIEMAIISFDILNGSLEEPKEKNWKYFPKKTIWR